MEVTDRDLKVITTAVSVFTARIAKFPNKAEAFDAIVDRNQLYRLRLRLIKELIKPELPELKDPH